MQQLQCAQGQKCQIREKNHVLCEILAIIDDWITCWKIVIFPEVLLEYE